MTAGVRARRKAERPGEILEAAFEEFVQKGFAGTRLEDVAARAGVTKGTVYFYFESKEQVFASMVRAVMQPVHSRVTEFLDSTPEPAPAFVERLLLYLFDMIATDPRPREIIRLLIAEARQFPNLVDEHYERFMQPIIERVQVSLDKGALMGAIRPSAVQSAPEVLISPAWALGVWMLLFADRKLADTEAYHRAAVDMILHGLLPRHSST